MKIMTCSNCKAKETPLWRRGSFNEILCNACGLYYRTHGFHRFTKSKNEKRICKRASKKSSKPVSLYNTLIEATSGAELESIIYNGVRIKTGDAVLVTTHDNGVASAKYGYVRTLKYQNSVPVFKPVWLHLRAESTWKRSDLKTNDFFVGECGDSFLPVGMISCLLGFSFAITPSVKTQLQPKFTQSIVREQVNRIYTQPQVPFLESKADHTSAVSGKADELCDLQAFLLKEAVHSALSGVNNSFNTHSILEQVPEKHHADCLAPASTPIIPSSDLDLSQDMFSLLLNESNLSQTNTVSNFLF